MINYSTLNSGEVNSTIEQQRIQQEISDAKSIPISYDKECPDTTERMHKAFRTAADGRQLICDQCFSENKYAQIKDFKFNIDEKQIVIKNVPCLICRVCGNTFFTDSVSMQLETYVNSAKDSLSLNIEIEY